MAQCRIYRLVNGINFTIPLLGFLWRIRFLIKSAAAAPIDLLE